MSDNEKINQLKDELRQERIKNLANERFIARMSHSLRTPIAAVLGISEIMLNDTSLSAHVDEAFRRIYNAGKFLLGTANDVLDLPKIVSGQLPLSEVAYNIASLISDITQLHLIHLGSRKIEYKVNVCPDIPTILNGDEFRIKQLLDNLLNNAFKYTESGTIELKAHWEPTEGDKGILVLTINDTGIGIEDENIFQRNEKIDSFSIPIIRSIIQALNAEITVQSEQGMGTHVTVKIPQKLHGSDILGAEAAQTLTRFQGSTQPPSIEPVPMPYGRALVVDDIEACLFLTKGLLGFYEIEADLASSGGEAIEKIINGNSYDIIFMDHIMPEIDGITATKALREMGYTRPIIALTANVIPGQEVMYLKNDFDGFIKKPIKLDDFDAALHRFVRDKQPQSVLDAVVAKEKFKPRQEAANEAHNEVAEKLRTDFARKQKDVYAEIATALGNGNLEAAQWLVDTVKNMAGMIGEPVLTKIATDVTRAIENGKIPTQLLEMLNQELTMVISGIPDEPDQVKSSLSRSEMHTLLDTVHNLLESDSAESMFLIEKLHLIPNSEVLISHIENFDFPGALKALVELQEEV
jgi:CheY-like chemotaxis protein